MRTGKAGLTRPQGERPAESGRATPRSNPVSPTISGSSPKTGAGGFYLTAGAPRKPPERKKASGKSGSFFSKIPAQSRNLFQGFSP